MQASARNLSDGRWHFQHGPIDIIAQAQGEVQAVLQAHQAAWRRFSTLLTELVAELPKLKAPLKPARKVSAIASLATMHSSALSLTPDDNEPEVGGLQGEVARLMWKACMACRADSDVFMTPMAAVAGSVAQCLIESYKRNGIERASVNNGGDIALYLTEQQSFEVGLFADLAKLAPASMPKPATSRLANLRFALDGKFKITADMGVQGIATSGWRGRSYSLGIADSVTVLASSASYADAAATLIANEVNIEHPGIKRSPANLLKDDTDLGEHLVTVEVPVLPSQHIMLALARGLTKAQELKRIGRIYASVLSCQGCFVSTETNNFERLN